MRDLNYLWADVSDGKVSHVVADIKALTNRDLIILGLRHNCEKSPVTRYQLCDRIMLLCSIIIGLGPSWNLPYARSIIFALYDSYRVQIIYICVTCVHLFELCRQGAKFSYILYFFLFLHGNMFCGSLLEAHRNVTLQLFC